MYRLGVEVNSLPSGTFKTKTSDREKKSALEYLTRCDHWIITGMLRRAVQFAYNIHVHLLWRLLFFVHAEKT